MTLSRPQERQLVRHAAARGMTPEEALQDLLDQPLPVPAGTRRLWSPDEIRMLLNPANRPTDIARRTGRTVSSVSNKRSKLLRAASAEQEPNGGPLT